MLHWQLTVWTYVAVGCEFAMLLSKELDITLIKTNENVYALQAVEKCTKTIGRKVMCSTAMISKWRMDYSKYSVSLTDQNFFFGGGGTTNALQNKLRFLARPHPLSFSYSSTLFLFLFFVSPWNNYVFSVSSVFSLTLGLFAVSCDRDGSLVFWKH